MAFAKKTWKDRIAEFPTRRRLTKEDNTSELVTVAREEGTLSQEGDAFSAENMNDLENRIDAEFTEVNGKLSNLIKNKTITTNTFAVVSDIPLSKPIVSCLCTYTNIALVAFPTNRGSEFWSVDVRKANDLSLNDISTTITVTYLDI